MASASSLQFSVAFRSSSSSSSSYLSNNSHLFLGINIPSLLLRHRRSSPTVLALSRRRRNNNSAITPKSPPKRNKSLGRSEREDDDIGEDAFEALFRQLEEDLKNDELPVTDEDDDISEEDLMSLERELEEVIGDDELLKVLDSAADESSTEVDDVDDDDDDEDDDEEGEEGEEEDEDEDDEHDKFEDEYEDEDDDEDERPVLKNWQLRRLAYALKKGRRKTNIKMLAAEICVDRAIVLEYLREPPPSLLMLSATLPDKPVPEISEPATEQLETVPLETEIGEEAKQESKGKVPVHMMQNNWSAQKRLKKVHIETLERIYRRTKRPTNSMVSNIVHVTNLPRKRVVKWFEDRRAEESVPEHRIPYKQVPDSETVSNS